MKKISAIILVALILTGLTACSKAPSDKNQSSNQSISENISSTSDTSGLQNELTVLPTEKKISFYGNDEIPNIFGNGDNLQGIEKMVFETHEFGDYTINLVGKNVKINSEKYPGVIFMDSLGAEVEKDGKMLPEPAYYGLWYGFGAQYPTFKIFEDKIGSYLSVYEMKNPVITMKYYFDSSDPTELKKAMNFAMIDENGQFTYGFAGDCPIEVGVSLTDYTVDGNTIRLGTVDHIKEVVEKGTTSSPSVVQTFESDEFKITDKNTLVDEDAGIRFTFNFSDPEAYIQYSAEKISQ